MFVQRNKANEFLAGIHPRGCARIVLAQYCFKEPFSKPAILKFWGVRKSEPHSKKSIRPNNDSLFHLEMSINFLKP